ncbi:hypothetical protein WA026_009776 [Henosepilachna vigintioctopunctata]|uniref:Uncharacterized protein n=1 Tax=Henosepilachna vigintioctopunctata TaxID=420089 RepID=A0AAW1TSS3_9CUCU
METLVDSNYRLLNNKYLRQSTGPPLDHRTTFTSGAQWLIQKLILIIKADKNRCTTGQCGWYISVYKAVSPILDIPKTKQTRKTTSAIGTWAPAVDKTERELSEILQGELNKSMHSGKAGAFDITRKDSACRHTNKHTYRIPIFTNNHGIPYASAAKYLAINLVQARIMKIDKLQ